MIPPIRIQLLAGPQAGLQTAHTEPRLPFGRDPHNAVAIDEAHLSRQHGELICEDGQWAVVNRSPNGTTVNGRRVKGEKPRALRPGDVVGVGGVKLFAVQFQPVGAPPAADAPPGDAPPSFDGSFEGGPRADDPGARMKRRGKLWTAIVIYLAAMLVVFVIIMTTGGNGAGGRNGIPPMLSAKEIADDVTRPIVMPRDERKAEQHLAEARAWYDRTGSRIDGVYQAYHNYKLSLAYAKQRTLDGLDQIQYDTVEKRLVKELNDRYTEAYAQVGSQQWDRAQKSFYDLIQMYPNTQSQSPVYNNFTDLLAYARSRGG